MESMGACLIANDVPFEGFAKDLFDRRVQGKSWKEISDEFELGSPGKARKLFTKHTGITDYQIKGEDLLKLAKGGLDPSLLAPKVKKLKMIEQKISDKIVVPQKLMIDGEEKVIQLWHDGVGQYTKLAQESGLTLEQVDQVVWREALKAADGDVFKAHQIKTTSQEGIKALRKHVFELRSNGYTVAQIVDHAGIPQDIVEQILGGTFKPSPFMDVLPKHPEFKPVIGRGTRPVSRFGSNDFPLLTDEEMQALYDPEVSKQAIQHYTGSGYSSINDGLRNGGLGPSLTDRVGQIDKTMKTVTSPMTVTRGMGIDGFGLGFIGDGSTQAVTDALVGTIFEDPAFLSTSIAPGGVFHRTNGVRLEIEVPPGAKGVYVQRISNHKSEYEFIMARNTKMMVTSVQESPGNIERFLVKARVIVGGI